MFDYRLHKPQPNAIATEQGWVNPDNNELLSSIYGLKSHIESLNPPQETKPKKTKKQVTTEQEIVQIKEPIVEIQDAPVIVEQPTEGVVTQETEVICDSSNNELVVEQSDSPTE